MRTSLLLAVALTAACSSSSSGPSPSEQCTDLGTATCTREAECAVSTGNITQSQSSQYVTNCEAGYRTGIDCSRVTQVTGHPDVCTSDLRAQPCSLYDPTNGLPLPASCMNLFN